ncbi:MAG: hypothetical protein NC124_13895 [Clostridium sp.]|nr:hypothetical protein [Clostridium sp.]
MIKKLRKTFMIIMACAVLCSVPALAASSNGFSFEFTDLDNHTYATTWLKENTVNYYTITLNKRNGLTKNTMSSSNIFGCRMKDMSIVPAADVYHTFSNYVSDWEIAYQCKVKRGDIMALGAKKDSASTSGDSLKISGSVQP